MPTTTLLDSGQDTANASSESTASVTPGSDYTLLVLVTFDTSSTLISGVVGCGLTWSELVAEVKVGNYALTVWQGTGTGSLDTIDITYGEVVSNRAWAVVQVDDFDTSDPIGLTATNSGTGITTLAVSLASAPAGDSLTFAAFMVNNDSTVTEGTGFTEIVDVKGSAPTLTLYAEHDTGVQSADISWVSSGGAAGIVLEIQAAAGGGASVTPNDSVHAHTAESPAVTQDHQVAPVDSAHGHAAESPAVTQVHAVAPADSAHAHVAESPAVSQSSTITPADSAHEHAAESPAVTQAHAVSPVDTANAHTANSPAVTQAHQVAAADSAHGHTAESPAVTQVHSVAPVDSLHGHTAESPSITASGSIAPVDTDHGHTSDSPTVTQVHQIAPADSAHGHTTDTASITQAHQITPNDTTHAHTAETPAITQIHAVAPAESYHPHTSDEPTVVEGGGEPAGPAPPERTLTVDTDTRTTTVAADTRTTTLTDDRTTTVPPDSRTLTIS